MSYTAAQSSDITSDSTIRSIFAVLRQSSGQSAETQPFGGNISATTSGGKFGLKRTGSRMMDTGKSSHTLSVVTFQMTSGSYAINVNGEVNISKSILMETSASLLSRTDIESFGI